MTFLTDPENDHYICEHNCATTIEPWRQNHKDEEIILKKKKKKNV